jgi:CRP-like cAMP-binding protein
MREIPERNQPDFQIPARAADKTVSESYSSERPCNLLLASLSSKDYEALGSRLELVDLKVLKVLVNAGEPVDYVYFPETAVISVVRGVSDGTYIETGTIGREGFAGISVYLGSEFSPSRLEVQVPGACMRMSSAVFLQTLAGLPSFRTAVDKFLLSLFDQVGQSVVCSSRHAIPQRCARWLLMAHDRFGSDTFALTHTTLARMLDVRRAGVTVAALVLRRAGLIDYKRGQVTVLDRSGLEEAACECYAVNRAHLKELYSRLTPVRS